MYNLIDAIKHALPFLDDYNNEPPHDADDDYIADLDAAAVGLRSALEESNELVIMHRNEYEDFKKSEFKLRCLENLGVDNWEGYDSAMEVFEKGDQ